MLIILFFNHFISMCVNPVKCLVGFNTNLTFILTLLLVFYFAVIFVL